MAKFGSRTGRRSWYVAAAVALAVACLTPGVAAAASPVPPPPPPGKSGSPGTDLGHYPKRPITRVAPVPATAPLGTVTAVTPRAGGGFNIRKYTPVAGISASDLYQILLSHGVPGLVDPAAPAGPTQSPSNPGCNAYYTSGTASTLCPVSHWANNGYSHPQVYFVDRTGASWPTDVSTYTWNQA